MSRILLIFFAFCISQKSLAQETKLTVVGENEEPLVGATVSTSEGRFFITNTEGSVQISCACDQLDLLVRHVGYLDYRITVRHPDQLLIKLAIQSQHMEEVVVQAMSEKNEIAEASSQVTFSVASISRLPYLLGERDPIKFIQLQTGVSTGTDGNNGYYVRGGGIDQNAIELDHMEFYNTNHLFGFFSMFSAEAIDRAEFLKAGYPAQVGGRLSSTLRMYTKSPDKQAVKGSVSLGLLSANVTLQSPVIKQKSGVLISYRRSYLDLITQNMLPEASAVRRSTNYKFSDSMIKYQHHLNKNNVLSVIGFLGSDFNDFQSSRTFSNQIDWQNWNAGLTWNSIINDHTDLEVYLNGGKFKQNFEANISSFGIDLNSNIQHWKAGVLVYHQQQKHNWTFGVGWMSRRFKPSQVDINTGKEDFALSQSDFLYTSEWFASAEDYYELNEHLRIGMGLRLSGFVQWGPFERVLSASDDTLVFAKASIVEDYIGLEPRVRVNYILNSYKSLKFSYDRTYQYIHLSPLSSVSLPTDLWVPSTSRVKPQNAHQLTFGYYQIQESGMYSFSAELFGKLLYRQVEWQNGTIAGYSDSPNFDDDLIFGKGHSYGIECSVSKHVGRITGELNYTLSRSMRRFSEVNQGDLFPAKYDRIHDLNVVGAMEVGNWTLSGLFKLASGTALTLPTAKYLIGERVISEYSKRNGLRMPLYHRLDICAVLEPENHPNVKWSFSVYNLYNRRNPYFIYFDVRGNVSDYSLDVNLEEVSLFPVLPSVSYQLTF